MYFFTIATVRIRKYKPPESEIKIPDLFALIYFLSLFYGRKIKQPLLTATHSNIRIKIYKEGRDFPFLYIF